MNNWYKQASSEQKKKFLEDNHAKSIEDVMRVILNTSPAEAKTTFYTFNGKKYASEKEAQAAIDAYTNFPDEQDPKYAQNEEAFWQDMKGAIQRAYAINPVGTKQWMTANGGSTPDQVVDAMKQDYEKRKSEATISNTETVA